MSSERRDVNRLFKHFGLDPADYTHFSDKMLSASALSQRVAAASASPRVGEMPAAHARGSAAQR